MKNIKHYKLKLALYIFVNFMHISQNIKIFIGHGHLEA